VEYLPQRIETLGAEAARARADYLKTLLNTVAICADLTETEQGIGDSDGAIKALERAEAALAKVRAVLSNPKHKVANPVRDELTRRAESLRLRLDVLKSRMA